MDKPADPATPFLEVYQHFLAVLKKHGRKESTRAKYLYDFRRFDRWLRETGRPTTLASLMDTDLLFTYRHHLEALPQQARGSIRQRNDATYGYVGDAISALTEVDRQRVRIGEEPKIVSLCKTFVKAEQGLWTPDADSLPEVLFADTV